MTTCFYLLPGARLPEAAARETAAVLAKSDPASLEAWTALGTGREPPGLQRLAEPLHDRSPHQAWLWKVLTHRSGAPITAPYEWIASGGPVLDQEFWKLTPWRRNSMGQLEAVELHESEMPAAACALDPIAAHAGMRLMISGTTLFLCRRKPWAFSAAPFRDLADWVGAGASLAASMTGSDKPEAETLLEAFTAAAQTAAGELPSIEGFWLSGGGAYTPIFPPSTYRALACDDPVVRAWAAAAGIPRAALMPVRGSEREEERWGKAFVDAPIGERIVVIEHLLDPWRRSDWSAWREVLPTALGELARWRSREKAAGIDDAVFVLFGNAGAATLLPTPKSFNPLKRFKRSVLPLESWFIDNFAGEVP